jgi:hypothetical protein
MAKKKEPTAAELNTEADALEAAAPEAEVKPAEKAAKEQKAKDALVAELDTFNITATGGTETVAPLTGAETVEELKELVKRAKADAKAAEKAAKGGAPAGDEVLVKFRDHAGQPTERTFSKEVHGDDFAKLADEFKATNAGRIIE